MVSKDPHQRCSPIQKCYWVVSSGAVDSLEVFSSIPLNLWGQVAFLYPCLSLSPDLHFEAILKRPPLVLLYLSFFSQQSRIAPVVLPVFLLFVWRPVGLSRELDAGGELEGEWCSVTFG